MGNTEKYYQKITFYPFKMIDNILKLTATNSFDKNPLNLSLDQ